MFCGCYTVLHEQPVPVLFQRGRRRPRKLRAALERRAVAAAAVHPVDAVELRLGARGPLFVAALAVEVVLPAAVRVVQDAPGERKRKRGSHQDAATTTTTTTTKMKTARVQTNKMPAVRAQIYTRREAEKRKKPWRVSLSLSPAKKNARIEEYRQAF